MTTANAQLGLLPAAKTAQVTDGIVVVPTGGTISYPDSFSAAVTLWRRILEDSYGVYLERVSESDSEATITFAADKTLGHGAFQIQINDPDAPLVAVVAGDLAGAHYAVQTLRQLAGPQAYRAAQLGEDQELHLQASTIEDAPKLEWRGVMLDVARRFWSKAELLRYIDLIAAHHFNVLQLHLTDDQGWRFEVDAYPQLTEVGSWRKETVVGPRTSGIYDGRPHGGFYTRADMREIAAYARARGVEVIPEVDLPGHSEAAIAAYPWLASDPNAEPEVRKSWGISENVIDPSPAALDFFKAVIDQLIIDMDPQYIGIGGDEVPIVNWQNRTDIVGRALDLGFTKPDGSADVRRLHGWFLGELAKYISAKGKRAVVWDDAIGEDLPKDVVVTVWHPGDVAANAMSAGYDIVLAPENPLYFDFPQSDLAAEPVHFGKFTSLDDVYAYNPVVERLIDASAGTSEATGELLGAQAQLWTEYLNDIPMRDYNMFPRLPAFAEVAWTKDLPAERQPGTAAHADFMQRLEDDHLPRLEAAGVAYRPLEGPKPWQQWPGYLPKEKPLYAWINKNYEEPIGD